MKKSVDRNESQDKKQADRFINIAAGGKKLTGEVERLEEIDPLEIEHKTIEETAKADIAVPVFDESRAYDEFLKEKAALREKYEPFLKNYSKAAKGAQCTQLKDFLYRKETQEDKADFSFVLSGKGEWEKISLPHYVGPDGRWNAFYRTQIDMSALDNGKFYFLDFEAVDYIAEVYVNGRLAGRHVGFFAPFSVEVTEYLHVGSNVITVVVCNDNTTTAVKVSGLDQYGDKIYGATHLGYDEPNLGWHHCPAGAGIFGKLFFVKTDCARVKDIFVRPDIDGARITVNTTFSCFSSDAEKYLIKYRVEGRNFKGFELETEAIECDRAQYGENYLQKTFDLPDFRLWTIDEPYLYEITVTLLSKDGRVLDEKQTHFGMRKFFMDESSTPKGAFYFNNERIMLRGTNEMGHLPRCVMQGDYEQLIDDILIAKVANLNFYRMTQRPVFDVIYTYFDMLGMLCQSDFPLFSYLKPSALGEALKQVDEMEKLTRNHPSVIVETFCNEALDKTSWGKEQYVFSRFEMEKFFRAAQEVVEINNPDRVIKYGDGDYAPLPESHGINDFHCYTYWYISHGLPSGKLAKGYLPPIRKDWMTGCGEFGVDGLDRKELMRKYCPKEWLPATDDEPWSPVKIAKEQCYVLHGDFFPEQNDIDGWISASRDWQKEAIKKYVHSLRLRSDYIESTAVHLLIDAWPCGWTKTLVDVDRVPKPAYYAFKEASIPVRVSLRRDKFTVYSGDAIPTEVYAFNDLPQEKKVQVKAAVYFNGQLRHGYATAATAKAVGTTYLGDILPSVEKDFVGSIKVVVEMISDGKKTFDEVEYKVLPPIAKAKKMPFIMSEKLECVKNVCEGKSDGSVVFADGDAYTLNKNELDEKVKNGARVVIFIDKPLEVMNEDIIFRVHTLAEEVAANNFVARNEKSVFTREFGEMDFMNFYNAKKDYRDLTAWFKFEWQGAEEILYSFKHCDGKEYELHKKHVFIAARKKYGKGEIILSTLSALDGCVGCNPVLDKFIANLVEA